MTAIQIIKPLSRTSTATSIVSPIVLSGSTRGQVASLSAIDAAWLEFETELQPWERQLFANNNLTSLQSLQARLQTDANKQGSESKALRCAKMLRPVIRAVEVYSPLVTTATSAAPVPAAASVLGAIQCFLVLPSNLLDMHEKITDDLQFLGLEASRLMGYQRSLFWHDVEMQTIIFRVFKDILQFFRETVRLFYDKEGRLRSTKMAGKSIFSNYAQQIAPLKSKIITDLDYFEKEAKLRLDQNNQRFQQTTSNALNNIERRLTQLVDTSLNHGGGYTDIYSRLAPPHGQPAMLLVTPAANLDSRRLDDDTRSRILDSWLPYVDFDLEHRQNSSRLENTSQWIAQTAVFQAWQTDDKADSTLVVRGRAGSGKSFLAASAFDYLSSQAHLDETVVVQVYCKAFDRGQAGITHVFGSVIRQMLDHKHGRTADGIVEQVYNKHKKSIPSSQEFKELAVAVSKKFQRVFVVVDGIDECLRVGAEGFGSLCSALHYFAASSDSVRLMCFCRPNYELFDRSFGKSPSISVDDYSEPDMRLFIQKSLFEDEPLFDRLPELRSEVEEVLLSKAKGVFLWLRCLVPSLQACQSGKEVREEMSQLPSDMTAFYSEQTTKILSGRKKGRKERALKILLWVCNAQRTLSRKEMAELLAVEPNAIDLSDDARIEGDGAMTSDCHDLVFYRDEQYQPMHKSLEDWVHQIVDHDSKGLQELQIGQSRIHQDIAIICLTYLQFEKFRGQRYESETDLNGFLEANPFYSYAAAYWGYHFEQIKPPSEQTKLLVQDFLQADDLRDLSLQIVMHCAQASSYAAWRDPRSTPLHLLAMFGLVNVAREYLDVSEMITSVDGYGQTPLDYAMLEEKKEMVLWILEQAIANKVQVDKLNFGMSPLHCAASADWDDVIEKLHLQNLDINGQGTDYKTCALHLACEVGSKKAVAALLNAGANLELTNSDGQTPIVVAARSGHGQIVCLLAEKGSKVDHKGTNGLTALHHTAINNDIMAARKLLQKSADPSVTSGPTFGNRTAMHWAAEYESLSVLPLLLSTENVDQKLDFNYTALMLAAQHGCHKAVQMIVHAGAALGHTNITGETAFHLAARFGHEDIVVTLHQQNPKLLDLSTNFKETALILAISGKHQKLCLTLLDLNASVLPQSDNGRRALNVAIEVGLPDLAIEILNRYPTEATATDSKGFRALHYAAMSKQSLLIEPLVRDYHEDINCVNNLSTKYAAVHLAALENDVHFLTEMFRVSNSCTEERKANWSLILESSNESALHLAADKQAVECIKFLLERNVTSTPDSSNNTPFHNAVCAGNLECIKLLLPKDIDVKGYNGQTALHFAVTAGHKNIIEYLVSIGADMNACDSQNMSAFHMAIETKQPEIAQFLLDRGVDIHTECSGTREGTTPLHSCAFNGDYHFSRFLLEKGCSSLVQNCSGETPFGLAVSSGKVALVQLFVDMGQNGIHVVEPGGINCLHRAAQSRNTKMVDYLLSLDRPTDLDLTTPTDNRYDSMYLATYMGDTDMVEHLSQLGVDVNGSPLAIERPIHSAAGDDDVSMLIKLLDLGADINAVNLEGDTALVTAAQNFSSLAVFILLCLGADSAKENWLGQCVFDIMCEHSKFWEKFDWIPRDLLAQAPELRPHRLCSTAIDRLKSLLDTQKVPVDNVLDKRTTKLRTAARALLKLSNAHPEHEADALTLLTEVDNLSISLDGSMEWECTICMRTVTTEAKLKCKTCFGNICKPCYNAYKISEADKVVRLPTCKAEWERLEAMIAPLRRLLTGSKLNTRWVAQAFVDYNEPIEVWVDDVIKQYHDLDSVTTELWWEDFSKPGRDFLDIIVKARALLKKEKEKESESENENENEKLFDQVEQTNDAWEKLDEELSESLPSDDLSLSVAILPCAAAQHRFIEIPHLHINKSDINKTPLNVAGRVSDAEIERMIRNLNASLAEMSVESSTNPRKVLRIDPKYAAARVCYEKCRRISQSPDKLTYSPQNNSQPMEPGLDSHVPPSINRAEDLSNEAHVDFGYPTVSSEPVGQDLEESAHWEPPSRIPDQAIAGHDEGEEYQTVAPGTQEDDKDPDYNKFVTEALWNAAILGKDVLARVTVDNCKFLVTERKVIRDRVLDRCWYHYDLIEDHDDFAAMDSFQSYVTKERWIGTLTFDLLQVVKIGVAAVHLFEPDELMTASAIAAYEQNVSEISTMPEVSGHQPADASTGALPEATSAAKVAEPS